MTYTSVHSCRMDIAKQIDQAMRDWKPKRLSQAELSRISGVPQPTISRTLKGESIPETETLLKISRALKLTIHNIDFKQANPYPIKSDEEYLLKNFRGMTDINKGRLLERSESLLATQNKSSRRQDILSSKTKSEKAA